MHGQHSSQMWQHENLVNTPFTQGLEEKKEPSQELRLSSGVSCHNGGEESPRRTKNH